MPGYAQLHLFAREDMELDPDLRELYNVSDLVPPGLRHFVKELILSPRGMGEDGNLTICNSCHAPPAISPSSALPMGAPPHAVYARLVQATTQ
jgi:hypothetical protein